MNLDNQLLDDHLDINSVNASDPKAIQKVNFLIIEANDRIKSITHARLALLAIIVFLILSTGFSLVNNSDQQFQAIVLIETGIIVAVFGFLALLVPKRPKVVLLLALVIYLLIWLVLIAASSSLFFQGIIFKVVVITMLAKGVFAAMKLQELLDQLVNLGVEPSRLLPAKKLKTIQRMAR